MRLTVTLAALLIVFAAANAAAAAPKAFDFEDPKGVNSMSFTLDSELEPIRGFTSGISGSVAFDPQNPKATTGKLIVAAASLKTPNKRMTEILHGADWLNVEEHAEITFQFKEIKAVSGESAQNLSLTVLGDITIKGITKELTIVVRATYLEGKLEKRVRGMKGDLLVLRTDFSINRSDFEIKKGFPPTTVAEQIRVSAQIVGIAPQR